MCPPTLSFRHVANSMLGRDIWWRVRRRGDPEPRGIKHLWESAPSFLAARKPRLAAAGTGVSPTPLRSGTCDKLQQEMKTLFKTTKTKRRHLHIYDIQMRNVCTCRAAWVAAGGSKARWTRPACWGARGWRSSRHHTHNRLRWRGCHPRSCRVSRCRPRSGTSARVCSPSPGARRGTRRARSNHRPATVQIYKAHVQALHVITGSLPGV